MRRTALALVLALISCGAPEELVDAVEPVEPLADVEEPAPVTTELDVEEPEPDWAAAYTPAVTQQLAQLGARRRADWARTFAGGWEVMFDGSDSPADPGDLNVPRHLAWDNPIDDDYGEVPTLHRLNYPSRGFFAVDRATRPADASKTGNFSRRDPLLRGADGITVEVRAKILPNSDPRAFFIVVRAHDASYAAHISPNAIDIGGVNLGRPHVSRAFNATSGFHVYRLVKQKGVSTVSLYIDGNPTPFLQTQPESEPGPDGYIHPLVLVGDNSNDANVNANYIVDYARYSRGAFRPTSRVTPPTRRVPPALPAPAPAGEVLTGYEGTFLPVTAPYESRGNQYVLHPQGWLELNTKPSHTNFILHDVRGLDPLGNWTIEARLKMFADTEERGITLKYVDALGASGITFSPNKVELCYGVKGVVGISEPVVMDTTDDFHVYRLVHRAGDLVVHLYVDNDPVPRIWDQHLEATHLAKPVLYFGYAKEPIINATGHALVDYIRWKKVATAPR